jgi:spore coat protein CotF
LGITKNRSGSTPPVSKAVAQSIERNNLQMGPTDLNSTTTAGTQKASAVSQTSPTATQASTSANANLKQVDIDLLLPLVSITAMIIPIIYSIKNIFPTILSKST